MPELSVVVPVHDGGHQLGEMLAAVHRSNLSRERWELIVVDDASTDDSAVAAAGYADTVVRLPGPPRGPAYARNRGAEIAKGEIVLFLDSDIRIEPGTLDHILRRFRTDPALVALSGIYHPKAGVSSFASEYRNLLRHFQQTRVRGQRRFWAACGAIRRDAFLAAGMFDEWRFPRPQVEDLELTRRLTQHGWKIEQDVALAVTHLKRWTVTGMLRTDVRDRAVPWMRLGVPMRREHGYPWDEAESTAIASALLGAGMLSIGALGAGTWALAGAAIAGIAAVAAQGRFYGFLLARRSPLFILAAIPLHLVGHVITGLAIAYGWAVFHLVGEIRPDPRVEAFAEVGLETWPPIPSPTRPRASLDDGARA